MRVREVTNGYCVLLLVLLATASHASVVDGTSFRGDAEVLDSILGYHYSAEYMINIESNGDIYILWVDEEFSSDDTDDQDRYFQAFIAVGDIAEHVTWDTGDKYFVFSNKAFKIPSHSSNPTWLNNNWEQMSTGELNDYIDRALRLTRIDSWMDDYERLQTMASDM